MCMARDDATVVRPAGGLGTLGHYFCRCRRTMAPGEGPGSDPSAGFRLEPPPRPPLTPTPPPPRPFRPFRDAHSPRTGQHPTLAYGMMPSAAHLVFDLPQHVQQVVLVVLPEGDVVHVGPQGAVVPLDVRRALGEWRREHVRDGGVPVSAAAQACRRERCMSQERQALPE